MKINNIQESKQGLKSKKLFDIVKSHGGFAEKTPSFYLHDITDNDVIGIVDGSVLDFLKKSYLDKRIQWAQKQGYTVNKGDNVEVIPLKDFTWVAIIERGGNLGNKEYLQTKIGNIKNDRYKNTLNRGDRQYQWSDTGKWGSPRAEEFYMRRTQNDIANQRRQRYGDGAVYKLSEHILTGLDKFATTSDIRRFTDSVIKKLYRVSQPYTSHRFRDNDWRSLRSFVNILREVYGVKELNLSGTGPYKQSQEGAYKEYKIEIETTLGSKIEGFIRCHFCGSQENPWDVYDMTVGFWKNNENNNINEVNMSKVVLNENELKTLINESVERVIMEALENGELDESWFGDKWKQAKSGFNTLTQKDDMGIGDRFKSARKNWTSQGELNNINNLSAQLSKFVEAGQLNPNMTIAQLIGGKINGNKFGRMSAMAANRKSQISKRGGTSYEE